MHIYIYIYMLCDALYDSVWYHSMHIYIYIERERDVCVYIYIYRERDREREIYRCYIQ